MGWRRKGDDIAERLLDLGAAVVKLLPALSKKPGGKAVAKQLERCGPAGGANYEEARGAESPADFVHKTSDGDSHCIGEHDTAQCGWFPWHSAWLVRVADHHVARLVTFAMTLVDHTRVSFDIGCLQPTGLADTKAGTSWGTTPPAPNAAAASHHSALLVRVRVPSC